MKASAKKKSSAAPAAVSRSVSVPCPKCGQAQALCPVTVMRPADTAALEQLFRGTLNCFSCTACKVSFRVDDLPLLFRDDERRILFYLAPPTTDDAHDSARVVDQFELLIQNVFGDLPEDAQPRPVCRLVRTRAELVEKIALLQADLDDRLVEYVKYQFFLRRQPGLDPDRQRLYYDFSVADGENLAFVVVGRVSGKPEAGAHLPMEVYRELASTFLNNDDLREELQKLFPSYVVSAAGAFTDDAG